MHWLQSIDDALFRFVNASMSNSLFDAIMPFFSSAPHFGLVVALLLITMFLGGGRRAVICALMLSIGLAVGDSLICNTIKHAVARPRPFLSLADDIQRVGIGSSGSMPSAHAANWFCATIIVFIYYRRAIFFMLPIAALVGFSRIYNGVHYPSDVLAGALLGAGYGAAIVWSLDRLWRAVGRRWFPIWWSKMPSLMNPTSQTNAVVEATPGIIELQWLRFGYALIGILLFARLWFLATCNLELSEDEAYQWIWSKHLALSYFSKPPMIAYTQWLGTHIWGDNEFGVRFFSPVLGALLSLAALRFMARVVNAKAGVFLVAIANTAPLLALGSILMTVDPLSVLFYTLALIAGWRAIQPDAKTGDWIAVGLWMGLGFLSKYTNLFQLLSFALIFAFIPFARAKLKTAGPWLALLILGLCTLPVIIWNWQHGWITVEHVATDGNLQNKWHFETKFTREFVLSEAGLLNPVYFIGTLVAVVAFVKRSNRTALTDYLLFMGAPIVVVYFILSFHTRVLQNWIAPSVLPLFALMVIYWQRNWARVRRFAKPVLMFGIVTGAFFVIVAHQTKLIGKMVGRNLPPARDPLHRVHGWKELGQVVNAARLGLQREGKSTFIIGDHYGFTSQVTFYLPEAKAHVQDTPVAYFETSFHPRNQFYFWPGYTNRVGDNAIFMTEIEREPLRADWVNRWWNREIDLWDHKAPEPAFLPPILQIQFESVTDLGVYNVVYDNAVVRRVQLFACRNLRRLP